MSALPMRYTKLLEYFNGLVCTMKRAIFCVFAILCCVTYIPSALASEKNVRVTIPKDSPRQMVLGAEFVLVEKAKLPEKIEIMRSRWAEIQAAHSNDIFVGHKIPLPSHHQKQWQTLISITNKNPNQLKTLRNVNGFFNSISSRKDKDFYGKNEHWASPQEFISNRSGDCEDYAITKYFALQYFKWSPKDLWLVFLHDNVNVGGHAVLVVKTNKGVFVLDNLSKPVYLLVPAEQYKNQVTPFAMANHEGFWLRVNNKKEEKVSSDNKERTVGLD